MTKNAEKGPVLTGPSRESCAVGAEPIVEQIARPVPVQTTGRTEFAARCPSCRDWHRHVALGLKVAPCGAVYRLEFANKTKGAA